MDTKPAAALPEGWPAMSLKEVDDLLTAPGTLFELEETEIRGVRMGVYKNAYPSLRAMLEHGTATWGPRDMLVYEDERVTFEAHAKAVQHLADALINRFGLKKGDRVAICMRNYPQWSVIFWACVASGFIATPLNSWWKSDELEYGLENSGASLAIVDPQIFERIHGLWGNLPDLENIIIARADDEYSDPKVTSMESLIGTSSDWAHLENIGLPQVEVRAIRAPLRAVRVSYRLI